MLPIVKVEGLSKQYVVGRRPASFLTLRDKVVETARSPLKSLRRKEVDENSRVWALREIDFEVRQGEVVGIIGRNGAGKSTLLKILSRIVEPTTGRIELRGRVGSLLEVGTGFHPELSGRENIYLNGAVLGMKRAEISTKFDEIVAFAEIEKFLDTPVKRYSSGMYMRLAFAVAAHLEPEILIVDEVLAVGDAAFQKKCLGKMGDVAREGRTVLFVSHNMQAVANLCERAILLEGGRVAYEGSALDSIGMYHKNTQLQGSRREFSIAAARDSRLAVASVRLRQGADESGSFFSHLPVEVEMIVQVADEAEFDGLVVGFSVFNEEQVEVFSSYYDDLETTPPTAARKGRWQLACTIPAHFMQTGVYRLVPDVGIASVVRVVGEEDQIEFSINNVRGVGSRYLLRDWRKSAVLPYLPWQMEEVNRESGIEREGEFTSV